jgi:hypothetical protein
MANAHVAPVIRSVLDLLAVPPVQPKSFRRDLFEVLEDAGNFACDQGYTHLGHRIADIFARMADGETL